MKRFIIMVVMMFSMTVASATYLEAATEGLTPTQQAELKLTIVKMQEAAKSIPTPKVSVAQVKEYSAIVTAIGTGVKDTAVQLGVAANDFVKTPVGMMTAGLIAWNYVGDTFLGVLVGGVWFMVMISGWVYFYRRLVLIESVEYYDKGARDDGKRKVVIFRGDRSDKVSQEVHFFLWVSLIVICATGFLVIF